MKKEAYDEWWRYGGDKGGKLVGELTAEANLLYAEPSWVSVNCSLVMLDQWGLGMNCKWGSRSIG